MGVRGPLFVKGVFLDQGPVWDRSRLPTIDDVERTFARLDGKRCSLMLLIHDEVKCMDVAGGNEGRYAVSVCEGPGELIWAVDPTIPDDSVEMVLNTGQLVPYRRRRTVPAEAALRAARFYAMNGGLDPACSWERGSR